MTDLAPVSFGLTIFDPCTKIVAITIGTPTSGQLTANDCKLDDNTSLKFYSLRLNATTGLQITMASAAFNSFLFFLDSTDLIIGYNDDQDLGTANSRIRALVPAGPWVVVANTITPGATGDYVVTVTTRAVDIPPCDIVWVARGLTVTQELPTINCSTRLGGAPAPVDQLLLVLERNTPVTVEMTTAQIADVRIFNAFNGVMLATATAASAGGTASVVYQSNADTIVALELYCDCGNQLTYQLSIR